MVFHTFSAFFSAIVGSFIFLYLALISHEVLFLYSTHSSPAFILGLKVSLRVSDSHRLTHITLSTLQGPVTLPFKAVLKTWLTTLPHLALSDTLFARYLCASLHQLPILCVHLDALPSPSKSITHQVELLNEPHLPTFAHAFHFQRHPSSALCALVHHKDSDLGSMSRSITSPMMSFTIHVSFSLSSLNIQ